MKAIVYTSNTGYTKEYARMLSEALALPAYTLKEAKEKLSVKDEIIYLGWLMAGVVKGFKKAKRRYTVKVLCGVGMAQCGVQVKSIREKYAIPEEIAVFSLQGGFSLEKLHGIYRIMMATMKKTVGKALSNKKDRTEEENDMLDLLQNGGSRVKPEHLQPVIDCIKEK